MMRTMESISVPPTVKVPEHLLLHGDDRITDELKELAESQLNEDEETKTRCLEELRHRLNNETDLLSQDDDHFLLAFLRSRKFDVERTFTLIKNFYSTIGKHSHIFYDFTHQEIKETLEPNCVCFLPHRDSDGCTVSIFRMSAWDPAVLTPERQLSAGSVFYFHSLLSSSTQIAGLKLIMDFGGLSFKHLTHIKPSHLWLFGEFMQNTFPMRMQGLHIVNENHLFHYIWIVLRMFLSKKLKERVHFHGKNVSNLHNYFDPSILPAEYGGKQPPFDNSDWGRKIQACSAYTDYVFSFGYEKYLKSRRTETI